MSAIAEPTRPVQAGWVAAVTLVNLGTFVAFFGPIQVLLAQQSEAFDPARKEALLALVTGCGAAVSMVCNPLFGAFSDRTVGPWGRRVPWVLGGAVLGAAGLAFLSGAPSVAAMVVGWCVVQAAANAVLAAITATLPDRVPTGQRAMVGGFFSLGQTLGVLVGVGLAAFWISPTRHRDYAWAWGTRFLVNLGNAIATLYLLYYLSDEVGLADPEGGLFALIGLYSLTVALAAIGAGRLSDALGRRKAFVVASGFVIATAATILALRPTWSAAVVRIRGVT